MRENIAELVVRDLPDESDVEPERGGARHAVRRRSSADFARRTHRRVELVGLFGGQELHRALGKLVLLDEASSEVAITSTIASPIATMSRLGEVTGGVASRRARARSTAVARAGKAVTPSRHDTELEPRAIPAVALRFSIFYGGMVCIAGVLGNKQVALGPAGRRIGHFRLPAAGRDVERGRRAARPRTANRLVLIGFVPLIVSLLLSLVVLALPASPQMDPARLSAFDTVMGGTPRIWLGGITAYGISTFLNVTIFSRLKAREVAACCGCAPGSRACSARSSTR